MSKDRKISVLVNGSNLHVGGGVAVASSFIDCLSHISHRNFDIHLLVSTEIDSNLKAFGTNVDVFKSYTVTDFYGISALWMGLHRFFIGMDVVFTVFGPAYFLRPITRHVFGFAQPQIIYPDNPSASRMPFWLRTKESLKYGLQKLFFYRADRLVVELEHVQQKLENLTLFKNIPIHVVHSCVHTIYHEKAKWAPVDLGRSGAAIKLGIISRNYPHKNLSLLPQLKAYLRDSLGLDVDFYVTFSEEEWRKCTEEFRNSIINIGSLRLNQCPTFYSLMDGVIFPSLLECFSAVPIESMMLKRPLFASDLPFVRDVCGGYCNYFDPLNVENISNVISKFFEMSSARQQAQTDSAFDHIQKFTDATLRANRYLDVIEQAFE